jgi:histone H3/H4
MVRTVQTHSKAFPSETSDVPRKGCAEPTQHKHRPERAGVVAPSTTTNAASDGRTAKGSGVSHGQRPGYRKRHCGLPRRGVKHMADKSGIIRISEASLDSAGDMITTYLKTIGEIAAVYAAYRKRNTITRADVVGALHTLGFPVYC